MCWMLGALENQRLTSSQQHCPGPGHPELVVTAKPSAMETIVQPQEQEAGQPPSARCLCAPLPCPCYAVVLGVGSLWTQKRCFCWEACKLAPPFHAKRPAQRAHVPPVPAAAFQLPGPPEDSVPGSAAGGERGAAGNTCERAAGWPGLPVSAAVFVPRGLARALLARPAGPPSCCGSRRFWGRKTETSPVFSRLPDF